MSDGILWLEAAKLAPIYAGGGFALYRYVRDQEWKRQQFATSLYKDFAANPYAKAAMTMIDWKSRDIELFPLEDDPKKRAVTVKDELLVRALRTTNLDFDPVEVALRDVFDQYLQEIALFEHHIDTGLIQTAQIKPYFSYWAKQMTGRGNVERDEVWSALKGFIDFYDYSPVQTLFERLGYPYPDRLKGG